MTSPKFVIFAMCMSYMGTLTIASRVVSKTRRHDIVMNMTGATPTTPTGWQQGLCACSDSESFSDGYFQFTDARECAAKCYAQCWNWRTPNDAGYSQIQPMCLAVYDSEGFVDVPQGNPDEEYLWKEAPMATVVEWYDMGEQSAKRRSKGLLNTWKGRAGVLTTRRIPEGDLPGTCICTNEAIIPFLDMAEKYADVAKCQDKCQTYCQSLNTPGNKKAVAMKLPSSSTVPYAETSAWAFCVNEELKAVTPAYKTECRCYSKATLTEKDGKPYVASYFGLRGDIKMYDSVERCKPKRCRMSGDQYKLPSTNPTKCFSGSCMGHCLEIFGTHIRKQHSAAECIDPYHNQHFTVVNKDRENRHTFRGLSQLHYSVHNPPE